LRRSGFDFVRWLLVHESPSRSACGRRQVHWLQMKTAARHSVFGPKGSWPEGTGKGTGCFFRDNPGIPGPGAAWMGSFGRIILPFTLLRCPECVLKPTGQDVRDGYQSHKETGIDPDLILRQTARHPFYHTPRDTLSRLGGTRKGQKTPIPTLECK